MSAYQTLPLALNQWAGNQFMPAPVKFTPRPKPLYAAALETPTATGQQSPAQSALGFGGDGGFQGGQPQSNPGQGMNAQSPSFGSFMGSALTGPVTAFGSLAAQTALNGLTGNPNAAINGLGMSDLGRALAESLGIGGGGMPGDGTLGSPGNPGPGSPSTPGLGDGDNPFDAGGAGAGSNSDLGTGADGMGGQDSGWAYARGGPVKTLIGPNPPGPDDGHGALDRGEYVVRKSAAKHYGKGLLDAINDKRVDKAKLKGLLGSK